MRRHIPSASHKPFHILCAGTTAATTSIPLPATSLVEAFHGDPNTQQKEGQSTSATASNKRDSSLDQVHQCRKAARSSPVLRYCGWNQAIRIFGLPLDFGVYVARHQIRCNTTNATIPSVAGTLQFLSVVEAKEFKNMEQTVDWRIIIQSRQHSS